MSRPSTPSPRSATPKKPDPRIPKRPAAYDAPPARRVRAIRTGHNEYTVVEETFDGPPSSSVVLKEKSDGAGAQYRCRLWLEQHLGPNRLGGTGLE